MAEWYPITAKFTADEKRILDILRDVYGKNYNQSLKAGIELFARMLTVAEFYATSDSKILKKIKRISEKYNRLMNAEIKQVLKEFPKEQQDAEYEKLSKGITSIFSQFDNIFIKNRKVGRKKLPKIKGRPSTRQ
jgi:hypothetical protein